MKAEDQLLFQCTRQDYPDKHQSAVLEIARHHTIDWVYVFNVAEGHCVAPLAYVNLIQHTPQDGLKISPEIIQKFKLYAYRNTLIKEKYANKLEEVLHFFNQNHIPVMLFKGSALDTLVYQAPWYTYSKDIDLIVQRRKEQLAEETIREIREMFSRWNIEYEYYEHHDLNMDGMLPVDFDEIWRDGVRMQFLGQEVWVMSPEDLLISVCINSCRKRFFRLKSLCDIAETIARYPDLNWEKLIGKARRYDCGHIIYAALLVTQMTIGCDLPPDVFGNLGPSRSRRAMIRQVVNYLLSSTSLDLYVSQKAGLFGRSLSMDLLLPYVTYPWHLIWRKAGILYRTRNAALRAWREI